MADGEDRRWVLKRQDREVVKWKNLRDDEREVLRQCGRDALMRAGVGLGGSLSLIAGFRAVVGPEFRAPFWAKFVAAPVFLTICSYGAALTTLPTAINRIISLPDSEMGELLRLEVENYNLGSTVSISEVRKAGNPAPPSWQTSQTPPSN